MKKIVILVLLCLLSVKFAFCEQEAKFYETLLDGKLQCLLCPRECTLKEGQTGKCTVRRNINGKLVSLVYAKLCSINIDPVEKKPLFHFLPGTPTLSVATAGCNLRCVFCQNWSISQVEPDKVNHTTMAPEALVDLAKNKNCPSISYTYSEPTAFYEYAFDASAIAKKYGIKNILVTSGFINPKPIKELCTVADAANVDLKGFSDRTYRKIAATKLQPFLDSLKIMKENGLWLEVGYLLIPTLNDSDEEIKAFTNWIKTNLGINVPIHFLRFFPQHKLTNLPPTPTKTMERAYNIAKKSGINYVYLGNMPGHKANNTYCHNCKKLIIERQGYFIKQYKIGNGKCKYCGVKIPGVFKNEKRKK